jgi:dimethylargininase
MLVAVTREVSARFAECELTHIERVPINLDLARKQHRRYIEILASVGCQVIELPEEPDLPDSVFVEDTAIVFPELAVITRPGAESRRTETKSIALALARFRPLEHITRHGTIDGGDVLVLGKKVYVGLSTRSNLEAIRQLQELLDHYGYTVAGVELHGCLHLKSAVTRVDHQNLLINKNRVNPSNFPDFNLIEVEPSEPDAANCLPIGDAVIFPSSFPNTCKKLEQHGFQVVNVDISELAKAEGAVTCCSLIVTK